MNEILTTTVESPIGPLTLIARDGVLTNVAMHEQRHSRHPRMTRSATPPGSRTSPRNSTPTSRANS